MSEQLPYRLEIDNRRAVVALLPELNEVPWADIERVGSEIIGRIQGLASPQLLVDLCALSYMGSAQVALVVRMYKLVVVEKKGKMVVANRDPMVLEVLKLSGLTKVWTIVDSREKAMSMLGGGSIGGAMSSGGGGGSAEANPLPSALAIIAAVAAAVFIVLHLANPALIPSRGDVFGILGGSVVAFLMGLWTMSSGNRGLGMGVVIISVAMLLYGVFEIAKPPASAGTPAPSEEKAEEAADTKEGDKKSPAPAADPAKAAAPAPAGAPPAPADPAKAAAPKDAPPAAPKTP